MLATTFLALTSVAWAIPESGLCCKVDAPRLTQLAAQQIANDYAAIIGPSYKNATALNFLSSHFKDISDSINILAGIPLGSVTFPTREAFMGSQYMQASTGQLAPLTVQQTVFSERTVTIIWTMKPGNQEDVVKGISLLEMTCEAGNWKLETLHAEFNSFSYNNDIYGVCTPPPHNG